MHSNTYQLFLLHPKDHSDRDRGGRKSHDLLNVCARQGLSDKETVLQQIRE